MGLHTYTFSLVEQGDLATFKENGVNNEPYPSIPSITSHPKFCLTCMCLCMLDAYSLLKRCAVHCYFLVHYCIQSEGLFSFRNIWRAFYSINHYVFKKRTR